MSQTSKRMFGCIKYSRRQIQPIRVTRKEKSRMIRVVENQDILSLPRLYIVNARWLTFDDLLNMECEVAVFRHHSFAAEDVKQFINHWMAGSNPKLMHLRLHGFELEPNWERILEGIEYGVWDKKTNKRPRNFQNRYIYSIEEIDCKNGLDFERKSDGMIGTVMHQSDWIDFFVWHDI